MLLKCDIYLKAKFKKCDFSFYAVKIMQSLIYWIGLRSISQSRENRRQVLIS